MARTQLRTVDPFPYESSRTIFDTPHRTLSKAKNFGQFVVPCFARSLSSIRTILQLSYVFRKFFIHNLWISYIHSINLQQQNLQTLGPTLEWAATMEKWPASSRCSPSTKSLFQMYRELSLLSRHVSRVKDSWNIVLTPGFLPH